MLEQELGTTVFPLYGYSGPTDGTYTVDGTTYDVNEDFRTEERYKEYAAAGLNVLLLQGNDPYRGEAWATSQTKKNMDNAAAAGLVVIVFDQRLHDLCSNTKLVGNGSEYKFQSQEELVEAVRGYVKDYSAHPAFYGIQLKDEPMHHLLDSMGMLYKALKTVLPDAFIQINLFPMNESARKIGYFSDNKDDDLLTAYRKYLEKFLDCTGADYILYDNYPFLNEGGNVYIRPDQIAGLVLASRVAKERGVELYNIAQTTAMDTNSISKMRAPSEADMQWQVNLLLAFGVKQISYFTYWAKQSNKTDGESFPDGTAFISRDGTVNDLYYWMRDIHANLQEFAADILPLGFDGCMSIINDSEIAKYATVENDTLSALSGVNVSQGKGAFITQLSDGDTVAFCIQNICDPEVNSRDVLKMTLTVNFDGSSYKLASIGDNTDSASISGRTVTVELKPGEAIFWFIEK